MGSLQHYGIKGMRWGVRKTSYDRPYSRKEIRKNYGKDTYKRFMKDPAHRYRAKTGIELIHKEPTKEELERIWKNWNLMSAKQKKKSDKFSIKLFGVGNEEHYTQLIKNAYVSDINDIIKRRSKTYDRT